jgi:hypothetical protein
MSVVALQTAFAGSTWEVDQGTAKFVPKAMTEARERGGLERWDLPTKLAEFLDRHESLVTEIVHAERSGYVFAPCIVCGAIGWCDWSEATPSSKGSACSATETLTRGPRRGEVVKCQGRHVGIRTAIDAGTNMPKQAGEARRWLTERSTYVGKVEPEAPAWVEPWGYWHQPPATDGHVRG